MMMMKEFDPLKFLSTVESCHEYIKLQQEQIEKYTTALTDIARYGSEPIPDEWAKEYAQRCVNIARIYLGLDDG